MRERSKFKQLKQISVATLLEESSHLKLILRAILAISVLSLLIIIWASFVKIKETAKTMGEVVPFGHVQVVQHLEGGIISQVMVSNGEKVKAGQTLMQLQSESKVAELARLQGREIGLILDQARLNAYLNNIPANSITWSELINDSKYNSAKNQVEVEKLVKDEKAHLTAQLQQRKDQESVLKVNIRTRKEKLTESMGQYEVWNKHVKLLNEEFQMYQKLRQKNLIAHKEYLVVLREINRAKGELVRLKSQIEQTRQGIEEAQSKLQELDSNLKRKARDDLGRTVDRRLEVIHEIEKLEEHLRRMTIKAPVAGIVKGLGGAVGNVIKPGETLAEVVPLNQKLIVETKVNPRDIGHIKIGDEVSVKVMTFDFARYGGIKGKLTKISASTFTDPDGKTYYMATTELKKQYIGFGPSRKMLRPGMTVEADIVTGEKTLLEYLLKPIHVSVSTAFHER